MLFSFCDDTVGHYFFLETLFSIDFHSIALCGGAHLSPCSPLPTALLATLTSCSDLEIRGRLQAIFSFDVLQHPCVIVVSLTASIYYHRVAGN